VLAFRACRSVSCDRWRDPGRSKGLASLSVPAHGNHAVSDLPLIHRETIRGAAAQAKSIEVEHWSSLNFRGGKNEH